MGEIVDIPISSLIFLLSSPLYRYTGFQNLAFIILCTTDSSCLCVKVSTYLYHASSSYEYRTIAVRS